MTSEIDLNQLYEISRHVITSHLRPEVAMLIDAGLVRVIDELGTLVTITITHAGYAYLDQRKPPEIITPEPQHVSSENRCPKCNGRGYIPEYAYNDGGRCFLCGGSGKSNFR